MAEEKNYWHPAVTADIVAVNSHLAKFRDNGTFINLILIKRDEKTEAFPNCWALPGGFMEKGESIEECAVRELMEETGLKAKMLAPVGVFSKPDRDPREQVISHAFMTMLISTDEMPLQLKAGDDAAKIASFNLTGEFNQEEGSISIKLWSVETGIKIQYKASFDRGRLGLITTTITYDEKESNAKLAFDHAEIIARTILRIPDLILPTSDKFGRSPVEHAAPPDPNSDAEMKKRLAEHLKS